MSGSPLGDPVPDWTPRPVPDAAELTGRYCRLERLDADRHGEALFAADRADATGDTWTYLPYGPFTSYAEYRGWLEPAAAGADPRFYAIIDGDPAGVASLMRIKPEAGSIEVGHIHYAPRLQRTRAATEAQYLLMRYVFDDLGYRRYEWKCDALNRASRAAAERLGFTYEGTFRQATVVKGRNRDTAWYAIVDADWPAVRAAFEAWLDPANFGIKGDQRTALARR